MPIDLNSASIKELATLPGVGPQRAYELALWRPYLTWDQVATVPGFFQEDVELLRQAGAVLGAPSDAEWLIRRDSTG